PMGGRGPGGRDRRCGVPEGARDPQSTSMAWRPPYQPQLPHTTWGCFTALQRGHRLREGALSVQLDARRLRLLALEVFFLGTAIVGLSRVDYRGFAWPPAGTYRIGRTIPTGTV